VSTRLLLGVGLALLCAGCGPSPPRVLGRPGAGDGEFRSPRGLAVSEHGIAVVDKTGRLQVLDLGGRHLGSREIVGGNVRRGLPIGVTWLTDGRIAVADTHSSRVRIFDRESDTESVFGEFGVKPGEFLYPQRLVQLADGGDLLVSDHGMGTTNRIQLVGIDGTSRLVFGGPQPEDGGLTRPMGVLALPDDAGFLVADQRAGIVRFASDGALVGPLSGWAFGEETLAYGLTRAPDGTLYCTDLAGHRVLRLDPDGTPTGVLGSVGTHPGQFREPWDIAWFDGRLYVADTGNHRVQRFDADDADWREP
jgi:sugar lactone lactonase YvrE